MRWRPGARASSSAKSHCFRSEAQRQRRPAFISHPVPCLWHSIASESVVNLTPSFQCAYVGKWHPLTGVNATDVSEYLKVDCHFIFTQRFLQELTHLCATRSPFPAIRATEWVIGDQTYKKYHLLTSRNAHRHHYPFQVIISLYRYSYDFNQVRAFSRSSLACIFWV